MGVMNGVNYKQEKRFFFQRVQELIERFIETQECWTVWIKSSKNDFFSASTRTNGDLLLHKSVERCDLTAGNKFLLMKPQNLNREINWDTRVLKDVI